MKPKLFILSLLASVWNFNYLQISVKAKWLNNKKKKKKNPRRRIEILFEEKPSLRKKYWSIYREVLSVLWPKFAVVKHNSKISNAYHQKKFRKRLMNRSSIKKLFLQISQYTQKSTCVGVSFFKKMQVGVSFFKKMQVFTPETLLKRRSNTGVFLRILQIFNNTCFKEHLWTAVWTFCYTSK